MTGCQATSGLDVDVDDLGDAALGVGEPRAQGLAVDVLHRDEDAIVDRAGLEHGDDVRMGQLRHRTRFADQTRGFLVAARTGEPAGTQDLDRNLAIELRIVRGEHDAHAAGAEDIEDREAPERATLVDAGRELVLTEALGAVRTTHMRLAVGNGFARRALGRAGVRVNGKRVGARKVIARGLGLVLAHAGRAAATVSPSNPPTRGGDLPPRPSAAETQGRYNYPGIASACAHTRCHGFGSMAGDPVPTGVEVRSPTRATARFCADLHVGTPDAAPAWLAAIISQATFREFDLTLASYVFILSSETRDHADCSSTP